MIQVRRLNQSSFILNCEWIETVEATPDTVVTLTNGKKYVVAENVEEVISKVVEYKQRTGLLNRPLSPMPLPNEE